MSSGKSGKVCQRTRPATMLSQPYGLLNRNAVRMPASISGQSFICKASICAATAAVGDSMGVGDLCGNGLRSPASLMCCENADASAVPAHGHDIMRSQSSQFEGTGLAEGTHLHRHLAQLHYNMFCLQPSDYSVCMSALQC